MCRSGSKTEQALCYLETRDIACEPTGFIISNDSDPKRIEKIKSKFQDCGSEKLIITCSRAEDLVHRLLHSIDRVICDVPCTGDGTFRKAPHLWRLFRPRMALEMHPLQVTIATAAARLLKPGGRMVYSTCSINPVSPITSQKSLIKDIQIEDEAVVASVLRLFQPRLR